MKVYAAINAVQAALSKEGIAKTRKNLQQGYAFRGIDEVMNALAPILATGTLAAILVAGTWRSNTRTPVWHDNERLFAQAVVDAPQSYRAHYMLGAWMFETKRKQEGEHHYRRAIKLFPYDPFMSYNLAMQYQISGMYAQAIPLYRWAFEIAPHFREGEGRENLALCLANTNQAALAKEQAFLAMRAGGARLKDLRRIVQYSDSLLGRTPNVSRTKNPRPSARPARAN